MAIDATHDPALKSWVPSANAAGTDFPIQNLPFGVFRRRGSQEAFRGGVAIGDMVIDLSLATTVGVFSGDALTAARAACTDSLNALMSLGRGPQRELRAQLSAVLAVGASMQAQVAATLVPQADVELALPARVGDYTDFYASIYHATNVGRLMRPDNPLLPNYQWVPIGYHGRGSSLIVSGQNFHRPHGQLKPADAAVPHFGASRRLDYELELGLFVGRGNAMGETIPIERAEDHLFGVVLLNDWSARDVQGWEYQPLGPFLAKNFATSISPWVVTMDALEPFRAPWTRPSDHPQPLPYLESTVNRERGAVDMQLEVWLHTPRMRAAGQPPAQLSASNFKQLYWTAAQLLTHHACNGCNMQPADLLGTGTQSGPGAGEEGSLLELSKGGKEAVMLPNGEHRTFLEDEDMVILRAFCQREGFARIGLGECAGMVLPAL